MTPQFKDIAKSLLFDAIKDLEGQMWWLEIAEGTETTRLAILEEYFLELTESK